MSVDGEIHSGLMELVKGLSGYDIVWSGKGGDEPAGEYLRVNHLPNDNVRLTLKDGEPLKRKGFLVLVLCSPVGEYEAVYREKAGTIAEAIGIGASFTVSTGSIRILNYSIKPGRRENNHWETPIWLDYRGVA